jgi:LDH2 family malate/lactate/ureidoglycolate dehydrogenase
MATSQICYSSIKHNRATGKPLQPGWAVDAQGQDSSESGNVSALKPVGGYKGQGLGMMVEVLSTLLTGAPFDHELSHLDVEPFNQPRQIGHFFLAMDISAFEDPSAFRSRLSEFLAVTRAQPPSADTPVIVPGDREKRFTEERRAQGIPLDEGELRGLQPYAKAAGVEL